MNKQIEYYQAKLEYEMDPCDLFNAMEKGGAVIPVDTRKPAAFEKEHIPGAVNLPHRTIDENSTKGLDKSKTYACYCKGTGCNASTHGALKLARLGFKVKEVIGGLESWKADGYSTSGTHNINETKIVCSC
jgi:rhodanese-related sulfurtransferase